MALNKMASLEIRLWASLRQEMEKRLFHTIQEKARECSCKRMDHSIGKSGKMKIQALHSTALHLKRSGP